MARETIMPVSAIECAPMTLAEGVKVVGLLQGALIRQCIEDSESGFVVNGKGEIVPAGSPVELLAERLGVSVTLLRRAVQTDDLSGLDEVEQEAVRTLVRITAEDTPLVSSAEYVTGAGMDPQLSDRIRAWQTHLETSVTRRGIYPESPEEQGYGEVPVTELTKGSRFAPQCPVGYDGPQELGFENEPDRKPWFWVMPTSVVQWPDRRREVASLETIRECGADLRGLRSAITDLMRKGIGVLAWKVVTRNRQRQVDQAEELVAQVRQLRDASRGKDQHCDGRWEVCDPCKLERAGARGALGRLAWQYLGRTAFAKLWDDWYDGVPVTFHLQPYRVGEDLEEAVTVRGRPDLILERRLEKAIRREAQRKANTKIGIAWINPGHLPKELQDALQGALNPHIRRWAIQVFFDPYESNVDLENQGDLTTRVG